MIRLFDIILAAIGLILGAPLFTLLWMVGLWDTGSPVFCQVRLGRHREPFVLLKFRTMRIGTSSVATHLVDSQSITRWGGILRKNKLDELPQLWNVLTGDMSLVGPRPCLPGQHEVILEREKLNLFRFRPGITGSAQISGIDMSQPDLLARVDAEMMESLSPFNYLRYLIWTVLGEGRGDRVRGVDRDR
jgi:O-antigen biosynthesis protein WbqP